SLVDVVVTQVNTHAECYGVFVGSGDAVLVRVSVQGAGCNRHTPLWVNAPRTALVWASTLQSGIPSNTTQDSGGLGIVGTLTMGDSSVVSEGNTATGVEGLLTPTVEMYATRITAIGTSLAVGVVNNGGSLRLENDLVRATSNNIARAVIINDGLATLINNNLD